MKKLFLITIILFRHFVYGQEAKHQDNSNIVITGELPDSVFRDPALQPQLWFYERFDLYNTYGGARIIPLNQEKRKYAINISSKVKVAWFRFDNLLKPLPETLFQDFFLIQAGDSVCWHLAPGGELSFTGKGSTLLNFQLNILKKFRSDDTVHFKDMNASYIAYCNQLANSRLKSVMDSLNSHKAEWGDQIYELLRLSLASNINVRTLNISNFAAYKSDTAYKKLVANELISMLTQQSGFPVTDSVLINNGFVYINYLYRLNRAYAQLISGQHYFIPFDIVFNSINKQYAGLLRDKLLTFAFISNDQLPVDAYHYLPDAINLVRDSDSKKTLQKMAAKLPGAKVFDFTFTGMNGKLIRPADFTGKVLIIDFWFNGCENCIGIANMLRPIITHYKNNKSVAFLSINVDKNKKTFIAGVKSGLYGSKDEIYGYTSGLGNFDPMLLYYDYIGFPDLLVIDKAGKIVSSSPPRGNDDQIKQEWISLIDQSL